MTDHLPRRDFFARLAATSFAAGFAPSLAGLPSLERLTGTGDRFTLPAAGDDAAIFAAARTSGRFASAAKSRASAPPRRPPHAPQSCADSWGRALSTGEPSLSIPCYAERRYGGVPDDELLMALSPAQLVDAIDGMEALSRNGLRYPIAPYGIQSDARAGLGASY